mmetsp:Transcript_15158/g.34464  ORF Transcript_15158/g.34464 Transcript_15158/m.34464 type:complete len:98 (-) Transcript_15158:662-955(-)
MPASGGRDETAPASSPAEDCDVCEVEGVAPEPVAAGEVTAAEEVEDGASLVEPGSTGTPELDSPRQPGVFASQGVNVATAGPTRYCSEGPSPLYTLR